MPVWLKGLPWKIIGFALTILAIFVFFQIRSCQQSAQQAAQAKVDEGQGGAFRNSATDAMNTVGAVNSNTINGADTSRRNEEEIRNAQGASQPVDPAANAGGLSGLCRRASHRNDAACRVQQPHPR